MLYVYMSLDSVLLFRDDTIAILDVLFTRATHYILFIVLLLVMRSLNSFKHIHVMYYICIFHFYHIYQFLLGTTEHSKTKIIKVVLSIVLFLLLKT